MSRLEPSLGATAPTYKKRVRSLLGGAEPLLARPQPSRAAERVLPCSCVLLSTHSHVKILSTPLTPLLQGGTITYTLYLCHFQKKKRHNFGQKLINLENFHISYTFQYPVPRCGATWPGPSIPYSRSEGVPPFRDFFLYTHCPSPSGPRSGTGRGTPSIGMRGLHYVYREGRAAISEGRAASPKEGSPRSTRAGASQRSGQTSGHQASSQP